MPFLYKVFLVFDMYTNCVIIFQAFQKACSFLGRGGTATLRTTTVEP